MPSASNQTKVFVRTITRAAEKLLSNPSEHLATIGGVQLECTYAPAKALLTMQSVLALWTLLFPESGFYAHMRDVLHIKWHRRFSYRLTTDAVNECVKLYRARLVSVLEENRSTEMNAMCMFMLLPEQVARRWLWHKNVDFQSRESFLRRFTREQYASLYDLYVLSVEKHRPNDELPCFERGAANTIWHTLKLRAKEESRMAPKSALAHNFFGFDMGFQLYPSQDHDRQAPSALSRQFLQSKSAYLRAVSTEERGAFEVNKEAGGLYWYLYRTLRSNILYNTEADVRLGTWVCPWFWFTMIAWGIFLIGSPVALISALWLVYTSSALLPLVLTGSLGAITPGFMLLRQAKKSFLHRAFKGDYWENVGIAIAVCGIGGVATVLVSSLGNYPSFWALVLSAVFLVPYMVNSGKMQFWKLPVLGKVLPIITLGLFVNDLYRYTSVLEFLWSVVFAIGVLLYVCRIWIAAIIGVVLVYIGTFWSLIAYEKLSKKKVDAALDALQQRAPTVQKSADIAALDRRITLGIYLLGLTYATVLGCGLYVLSGMIEFTAPIIVTLVVLCAPLTLAVSWQSVCRNFGVQQQSLQKVTSLDRHFHGKHLHAVKSVVLANPFWFDASGLVLSDYHLHKILGHVREVGDWAFLFLDLVKSEEGLLCAQEFLASELRWFSPSASVAKMVADGASEEEIKEVLERNERLLQAAQRKHRELIRKLEDKAERIIDRIAALGDWTWRVVFWLPITIGRGLHHGYMWWKAMNEACPLSPPHERGILQ